MNIKKLKQVKFQFLFAWFDLWVGFFWDKKKQWLYFFPFPCVGVVVKFQTFKEEFKTMHVEHHTISPVQYKVDFIVNEYEFDNRRYEHKKTKLEIVREIAAMHLRNGIYDEVIKDVSNDVFKLIEIQQEQEDYYKHQKRYCIEISICPEIKEKYIGYGYKLVEPTA